MNKFKLKHLTITGGVMLTFLVVIILTLVVLWLLILSASLDLDASPFPNGALTSPQEVPWDSVHALGGWGELLDEEGRVAERIGRPGILTERYRPFDFSQFTSGAEAPYTRLAYPLPEENTLVLVFPSQTVTVAPTIQLDQIEGNRTEITWMVLVWLAVNLVITLLLARWLRNYLSKELAAQGQAEQKERMEIFRGLAHDIKTPLAAMMSYTKAMADGIAPASEQQDYLDTIYRQGMVLNERVTNLLSITSFASDYQKADLQPVDLTKETRESLDDLKDSFRNRGLQIEQDPTLEDSFVVPSQAALWRRCLENIVSNAVKHNERPVTVTVCFDKQRKLFAITDNGRGISEERIHELRRVFDTSDGVKMNRQLAGVGLFTTHRILRDLGWDLSLQNNPAGGLRVLFLYKETGKAKLPASRDGDRE